MTRARVGAFLFAALIATVTLIPTPGTTIIPAFTCLVCGDRGMSDLLLNVALFVPLGAALVRSGLSARRALIVALGFSAAIELAQLWIPGRSSTLRDVATNALGAWLGAITISTLLRAIRPGARSHRWLATAVALALASVGLTGWLLRPTETTADYFGQWAPELPGLETWPGTVVNARAGELRIDYGRAVDSHALRDALRSAATLRVDAMAGPPHGGPATIFAIADARTNHLLMLLQDGPDLVLRVFRHASMLHLYAPETRFIDALAGARAGDSFTLELHGVMGTQPCLSIANHTRCAERFGSGSLWTVLSPSGQWSAPTRTLLDATMILLLAIPVGLLMPAASRAGAVAAAAALAVGLEVVAPLVGLLRPGALEWSALALGLFGGVLLSWILRSGASRHHRRHRGRHREPVERAGDRSESRLTE